MGVINTRVGEERLLAVMGRNWILGMEKMKWDLYISDCQIITPAGTNTNVRWRVWVGGGVQIYHLESLLCSELTVHLRFRLLQLRWNSQLPYPSHYCLVTRLNGTSSLIPHHSIESGNTFCVFLDTSTTRTPYNGISSVIFGHVIGAGWGGVKWPTLLACSLSCKPVS